MSQIFGPSRWRRFDGNNLFTIPESPGVYVFLWILTPTKLRPSYIGSSRNLRNRVRQHMQRKFEPMSKYRPWPDLVRDGRMVCKYKESRRLGDWLMFEARLIYQLWPEFNERDILEGFPHGRRRSCLYGKEPT
jgi:excinuclease UvrABC nuclease subunit